MMDFQHTDEFAIKDHIRLNERWNYYPVSHNITFKFSK